MRAPFRWRYPLGDRSPDLGPRSAIRGRGRPSSVASARCAAHPRPAVFAHRSVTHVRHHRGAEQEHQERQHDQVPPTP